VVSTLPTPVNKWVSRFRTGQFSTEVEERSGRPTQVTIPENVDEIYSMILDDRKIATKKIAETLAIYRERVGYTRGLINLLLYK
jgi:hypothetical protein